jgi:hypothetical protein
VVVWVRVVVAVSVVVETLVAVCVLVTVDSSVTVSVTVVTGTGVKAAADSTQVNPPLREDGKSVGEGTPLVAYSAPE